ncbi:Mmp37-domain-containing protein [Epithele typhae]|uniref:Mmp37-domain-containing protein n=1 Tax=Epithele typhae TaxID=378194 RepID=UPI00200799C5|nr:Mmp37-domain-containing protein [Epithele typhae]KAH9922830.1 Mmp37-domain-containing protein [Epithele typhae]
MLARTHARRIPAALARSLSTEPAASSGPQPPLPPPPSTSASASQAKLTRTRLGPTPPPSILRTKPDPSRTDSTRALLEAVVARFDAPIRYAFAYGRGVRTRGYTCKRGSGGGKPMLDFMFAIAPGVWFNSMVTMNGVTIKYGVTTVDNLCSDLLNWRSLYLSGRMHKPIRIIKDDARVRLTQQVNLTSAVRTALLTLPAGFSERELFARIAGFSYAGDVRMLLPAENRGKVGNIVRKQAPQFRELYHRLATALPGVHWPAHADALEQDVSPAARAAHLRKLPSHLLARVTGRYAARRASRRARRTKLQGIVRGPSTVQTLKGVVSAGPVKSVQYAAQKVSKWWTGSSSSSPS